MPLGDTGSGRAAVDAVRDRGGRAGLLLVVPGSAHSSPEQIAFELKTSLTNLRGELPGITLGVGVPPTLRQALVARDLEAYADIIGDVGPPVRSLFDTPPVSNDAPGMRALPPDVIEARRVLGDFARAAPWMTAALVPAPAGPVRCGADPAPAYLDPASLATIAVVRGCEAASVAGLPDVAGVERVALASGDVLVRIPPVEGQFASGVQVLGARQLSVQEVVARHQSAAAAQRSRVASLISRGTMTLTFEAPGFPAPIAISSETIVYAGGGRTELEQRRVLVNGIEFRGSTVPRLPIIEPERVASPPLTITLTDVYRYALAGVEPAGSIPCYVVEFTPARKGGTLFSGRAWIAADSFALVKVAAAQTGLRGPIVTSEQIDEFREWQPGIWLLRRSEVRQMYEGAGHRTPIHRVLEIEAQDVNPPDFDARRAQAYASESVMLRDTPAGYRYLHRDRKGGEAGIPSVAPVLAARAQRVRTLAVGAIIDPNITRPLPFAGLSYSDFNFLRTGTQLTAFFGGTYGQLAFSVPSLGGSRWQLAGRAFGIASSFNDRAFVDGREVYEENIRQRPAHVSAGVVRPLGTAVTMRAGYELDYTSFSAAEVTDPAFAVPADQVAHAVRLGADVQRAGWHVSAWWAGVRRSGWRPWGLTEAGGYRERHRDFQRYGGSAARPFVLTPRLVGRLEGAWMAGRDLDRFSRYSFGTFDNRLRGYPSALIRYDRGAVLRAATAWAAARTLRVDGFVDTAYVHDPGFGRRHRRFTGVGAALEAPAPFGTLVAVEWGYGFEGVRASGGRGTQVIRITGFKIF